MAQIDFSDLTGMYGRGADFFFEFNDEATLDHTEKEYFVRRMLTFYIWLDEQPKAPRIWCRIGDSKQLHSDCHRFLIWRLLDDALRLEWMNQIHNSLNEQCGHDGYAWAVIMNHNVNRLFLSQPKGPMVLDVKDSACTRVHDVRSALDNAGAKEWRKPPTSEVLTKNQPNQ